MKQATVALETLGCKLNQAETEFLARQFGQAGFRLVDSSQPADVWILNTCSITHIADRKSRHLLRLARRLNPRALLIATGCYAHRAPDELSQMGEVDLLADNQEKLRLVEIVSHILGTSHYTEASSLSGPGCGGLRTRALVKMQDGCNDFCSYCIVPYVRGREHSLSPDEIINEVQARVDAGYKEIIITGTKLGAYHCNGTDLRQLLEHILAKTRVARLRLSSLQPNDLTASFLSLWSDARMCAHIHLPLQSGSPSVLQNMRRRYSPADFEQAVRLARQMIPDVAITTDVIVGFPGEGPREFEESYRFCEDMEFAAIHVFPYSARPGTLAASMPQAISAQVKREHSDKLLGLSRNAAEQFRRRFLGKTVEVLWENKRGGVWQGLTCNYIRVKTDSRLDLANSFGQVRLLDLCQDAMIGELVKRRS
jgi:threonylcarbamoyladenosine tRNA methylthiotransferase MtaB